MSDLTIIQQKLKVPKGQVNTFGNYKYRSCEDILEAVKPIIHDMGYCLIITDEVVNIGTRFYIKATVELMNDEKLCYTSVAYAREEETKKGMDGSQITGAASSYARKYALNGLFAIDDTKDADSTNTHDEPEKKMPVIQNEKFNELMGDEPVLPWLNENTKEFTGAVEKMKAGKSSVPALRKYFKISKKVEALLKELAK
jgi:hypothetical protein